MKATVKLASVQPWDAGAPAIHGPDITGASPRKPFLYAIPSTGERPLQYAAEGLPEGLHLNPSNGHITGAAGREGDFKVLLKASNRHGRAEKEFTIAIGRGLALTPPMGWNSWNAWRRWVSDAHMRAAADGLVKTGLAVRGYTQVNIDSCWQGERGGTHGAIQPNRKFPDMKALADYLHGRGLRFGIYSTPWVEPWGCSAEEAKAGWDGGPLIGCSSGAPDPEYPPPRNPPHQRKYVGLVKHEPADVAQWVDWEVDFLKYDWIPTDARSMERMGRILKAAPRDIVLSICTEALIYNIDTFKAWGHMWRGMADTQDNWKRVHRNGFRQEEISGENCRMHLGPGCWHDLDMFALGPQFSAPDHTCPNKLTPDEQITFMTAWAAYPSPLFLSCSLENLSDFELRLFGNEEVIGVNQDRLGKPSVRIREERGQPLSAIAPRRNSRVWAKPLADGSLAVAFFNLAETEDEVAIELKEIGFSGSVAVRDLWARRDLGRTEGRIAVAVPSHGAQLLKIRR